MTRSQIAASARAVRLFSRFYTLKIGVFDDSLINSGFSLLQVRVLYEIAHGRDITAREICDLLRIDPGYLSRMLRGFEKKGLLLKQAASHDARVKYLSLTEQGQAVYAELDRFQQERVEAMLADLTPASREQLVAAMGRVRGILDPQEQALPAIRLRDLAVGDIGWLTYRHAVIYSREFGWGPEFEKRVAEVLSEFKDKFDPRWEKAWIAEMEGRVVGCIFICKTSEQTARLRMLLVEPEARGRGLARMLVRECIRFSQEAGYAEIMLWTANVLQTAKRIYRRFGFRKTGEEPHNAFGVPLMGETWLLDLSQADPENMSPL